MKNIILILSVFFVLQSCAQNDLVVHKSNEGFSLSYSNKDWIFEASNDIFLLFTTNQTNADFKTNINILVQDLSMQPMSLNEYNQLTLSQIEQATGENNIEYERDITVSGNPAKELTYHIPQDINRGNSIALKIKQVYLLKNNKAYLITYTAKMEDFATFLSSANEVFETFKVE